MYQHGMHKYSRPDLVPADNWHLNVTHSSQPSRAPNTVRTYLYPGTSLSHSWLRNRAPGCVLTALAHTARARGQRVTCRRLHSTLADAAGTLYASVPHHEVRKRAEIAEAFCAVATAPSASGRRGDDEEVQVGRLSSQHCSSIQLVSASKTVAPCVHCIATVTLQTTNSVRELVVHRSRADQFVAAICREVHTTYNSQGNPDPTINLGLIFLVIASGMGVVLGIPYMLYGKNSGQAKSWAQQLEDSRKVRVGHVS